MAGGSRENRRHAESYTSFSPDVDEIRRRLVCDAMTSGGLLVAVPTERAAGVPGAAIGELPAGEPGAIAVR